MPIPPRRWSVLILPLALAACDQFESPDVARIESIDPDSGAIGSLVILQSQNLFNNTLVVFHDDVPSPMAAVFSDERIVTIVPEGATSGDVRVETAGERGSSRVNFTVIPPPPTTPAFFEDATGAPATDFLPCPGRDPLDDGYAQVTLPFPFPYYGREQLQMFVSMNGLVSFDAPRPCDNAGDTRDFATPPTDKVALLGFDLARDGGQVLVNVSDPAQVVVTWSDVALFALDETSNTFQLVLYPDGRIRMNYGYLSTRGIGATQPLLNGVTGSITGITSLNATNLVDVTFTVQSPIEIGPSDAIVNRFFLDRFCDLENRSLLFTPREVGGVFAGYRAELLPAS
ncbi:MAG TPA: hypothetical protein VIC59_10225 [Gemmatimonadota bacterium]|jgi:hypothetical protein